MDLILRRTDKKDYGIFGEISVLYDHWLTLFYSLEHSFNEKPVIPEGEYVCARGTHRLYNGIPFETFEITGIMGHSGLLFHAGNFNSDSEGCVLLGKSRRGAMIMDSKIAFNRFMELQKDNDIFKLMVIG